VVGKGSKVGRGYSPVKHIVEGLSPLIVADSYSRHQLIKACYSTGCNIKV